MYTTTNTNTLTTLRRCTSLVEKTEVNGNTIELLVDEQAVGDYRYREHFLVINGEWDMTSYRTRKTAKNEYDSTVAFWQD